MRNVVKVDPVTFAESWAQTITLDIPELGQTHHLRQAMVDHASALYDNPLTGNLPLRERWRLIRKQLAVYKGLIDRLGVIPTLKKLKDDSLIFLRCFRFAEDGSTLFELDQRLRSNPLWGLFVWLSKAGRVTKDNIHVARYALTWCVFLSKTPLTRPDLKLRSVSEWMERQILPKPMTAPREEILALRSIVRWLVELRPEFYGAHGPGSTAGGAKTIPDKNKSFRLSYQIANILRYSPVGEIVGDEPPFCEDSELAMVDKDIGSLRPITMMPPALQFAQQGIKDSWYFAVDVLREENMSNFVRFSDQTPSRVLALHGSGEAVETRSDSTIDLKNSSDRVLLDLVIELFSGDTLHYLLASRSWRTKVEGAEESIELSMFDGMGSATTFPVQTTIFIAVALWSLIKWVTKDEPDLDLPDRLATVLLPDGIRKGYRELFRRIRVYGDDIILPSVAANSCMELLVQLGLEVNRDKSFIGLVPVREACGVYAIGGFDVTPLRLKLPILHENALADASYYESLREYINASSLYGYKTLYRSLLRKMRTLKPFARARDLRRRYIRTRVNGALSYHVEFGALQLLYTDDYRPGIGTIGILSSRESIPDHSIDVWERRRAVTALAPKAVTRNDNSSEFYHLSKWWMVRRRREIIESIGSKSVGLGLASAAILALSSHGKIPRGTRLVKANAVSVRRPTNGYTSHWEWAPGR